ncbi:GGDEF domain-containing protein [Actinoplanes oblitus]|uniref:GGDEF domain-containing protein n=1 Tax=Actinoplanes oblitus TaxID=3040509 RepID=A0ABY8WP58_9ACTN|nr:GGDEF domain-containing protein [Actinoplanes oblitus]WIM98883.1 GGDEF domain-containing protein [Actinoplanes oblitus]
MRVASDQSLLTRRRTVEASALVSRGLGWLSTVVYLVQLKAAGPVPAALERSLWAGIVAMAAANLLAFAGWRRPGSRWYSAQSAGQVALDSAVIAGLVAFSDGYTGQVTWPIMAVPVVVAAIRHRLGGALTVWAFTSIWFGLVVAISPGPAQPRDAVFSALINLLIALVTGTQATAFARQLATLQQVRSELQHQATHDPLTGLPNRARLAERAAACTGRLGVLLLDLNGFKQVNDTYGHASGDELLHQVALRLSAIIGSGDLVGRLGGDEFLVLLPDADPERAARVADRIREVIRRPIQIGDGREVTVGVSVGLAVRPADGTAALDTLTAEADAAMYREKHTRRAA